MFSVSKTRTPERDQIEALAEGETETSATAIDDLIEGVVESVVEDAIDEVVHGDGDVPPPPMPKPARRRSGGIALALGGGAAKGWSHIGLLRAFDEAKVPISMIAGTSIGALVGGCYLAGKLDSLEEFARSITRSNIFRHMDFALRGPGLISGQRLAARMTQHIGDVLIEDLPGGFVTIATDIATGHEIWLHDGPLIEAIRASYALPGVFTPVRHNGRLLVDGALVNPVPVSACRTYEPDLVIAVDLNSETFGRGTVIRSSHYDTPPRSTEVAISEVETEGKSPSWISNFLSATDHGSRASTREERIRRTLLNPQARPQTRLGMAGVMMEAFNIIQDRIARARLAGDPPDYTIRPKLYNIGLADFHKADQAIAIGYEEARSRIKELIGQGELVANS